LHRLTRPQRIFVSAAGPLAGFVLGGIALLVALYAPLPDVQPDSPPTHIALEYGLGSLIWVNIGWGAINLLPILPLDGGHILEDILGPKRIKATAAISITIAVTLAVLALRTSFFGFGGPWTAMIFGLAAFQSYRRYQAAADAVSHARPAPKAPKPDEAPMSPAHQSQLARAKEALADDRYDEAATLAELVLSEQPVRAARIEALHVVGWAHLLQGRVEQAERVLKAIHRETEPDLAFLGALLFHREELDKAREVFEKARAAGDDRKEIVGPLIQILIGQGEIARAAAIALDVVDALSDEDARQMATIAFEHEAYRWAARLRQEVFTRTEDPEDAYAAARALALQGDLAGALSLLRRAAAAGYSDAARVWSDKALEALRSDEAGEIEALFPRSPITPPGKS
ncbi:MAG: site-2 protease family protein, partial [Myxococcales bacterium]|nr:site-2 protease family protein [Myxococcales bacterium]